MLCRRVSGLQSSPEQLSHYPARTSLPTPADRCPLTDLTATQTIFGAEAGTSLVLLQSLISTAP